jgi:hypothetical protein
VGRFGALGNVLSFLNGAVMLAMRTRRVLYIKAQVNLMLQGRDFDWRLTPAVDKAIQRLSLSAARFRVSEHENTNRVDWNDPLWLRFMEQVTSSAHLTIFTGVRYSLPAQVCDVCCASCAPGHITATYPASSPQHTRTQAVICGTHKEARRPLVLFSQV